MVGGWVDTWDGGWEGMLSSCIYSKCIGWRSSSGNKFFKREVGEGNARPEVQFRLAPQTDMMVMGGGEEGDREEVKRSQ